VCVLLDLLLNQILCGLPRCNLTQNADTLRQTVECIETSGIKNFAGIAFDFRFKEEGFLVTLEKKVDG
jgi:hypothetical protein